MNQGWGPPGFGLTTIQIMSALPGTAEGTNRVPGMEAQTDTGPTAGPHHSPGEPGGFRIRLMQAGPLFVQSTLLAPFRELLAPLARWLMQPHVHMRSEEAGGAPVDVPLRRPSLLVITLGIVLGPLVFVMLLPLILILVPAVVVMGFVGVLIAALPTDQGYVHPVASA